MSSSDFDFESDYSMATPMVTPMASPMDSSSEFSCDPSTDSLRGFSLNSNLSSGSDYDSDYDSDSMSSTSTLQHEHVIGQQQKITKTKPTHTRRTLQQPKFSDPSALVTFLVGPEETKFVLHQDFVVHRSSVLKRVFKGNYIERQTQTLKLRDISQDTFGMFMHWAYTQALDLGYPDNDNNGKRKDMALAELWVLGDKFHTPGLQNLVIREIDGLRAERNRFSAFTLKYIYENTAPGCALRKLALSHAYLMEDGGFDKSPEVFPHEFLIEFGESVIIKGRTTSPDIPSLMLPEPNA